MKLPNKLFAFEETTLAQLPIILELLNQKPMGITELFEQTKSAFSSVSDFYDALLCLYALRAVKLTSERKLVAC